MSKVMYKAEDIAADLSISSGEAAKLLKGPSDRMEESGFMVVKGMIPKAYYEKQKEAGFPADETGRSAARVPMNEKRLLGLEEFCEYAGGIGICTARRFIRRIGVEVRIGDRCLVDRVKFDRWCDVTMPQIDAQKGGTDGSGAGHIMYGLTRLKTGASE